MTIVVFFYHCCVFYCFLFVDTEFVVFVTIVVFFDHCCVVVFFRFVVFLTIVVGFLPLLFFMFFICGKGICSVSDHCCGFLPLLCFNFCYLWKQNL